MATRRKLDDALDYGRQLQSVHELQAAGASAAPEDIVAILDVSEVDADAQPKKITLQDLVAAAGGGSATPAGNAGEIQINDGAVPPNLGAVTDFKWDSVDGALDVPGDINLTDGGTYSTTLQTITPTVDRVISFPDATGTVALVGGSSGQLVYNSAGAYAGTPTLTYDGSILTSSGRFINSYNATASSPAKAFTGTWFTGGTATTTKPHVLIEPSGTTSTAWSTSGTGLGVNAASGFAGNLLDLQVGGASYAFVNNGGIGHFGAGTDNAVRLGFSASPPGGAPGMGLWATGSGKLWLKGYANVYLGDLGRIGAIGSTFGFSDTTQGTLDTLLTRDAAGTLAQRNGTNAQTYRLYNTYTDASNYERVAFKWDTNTFKIEPEAAGTGTLRSLAFSANGAASTPPVSLTGTWFSGGTSTTTKPALLIEPAGTTSTAWSTSGTGLGINAASGFAGPLAEFQVNGTRRLAVNVAGSANNGIYLEVGVGSELRIGGNSSSTVYFTPGNIAGYRMDSSAHFYPTNNNSLDIGRAANRVRYVYVGTLVDAASIALTTAYTVSTLPDPATLGQIARVTDASAPAVGSTVAGGGAAAALVWWNGANWTVIGV